jgi:hypothetical protein
MTSCSSEQSTVVKTDKSKRKAVLSEVTYTSSLGSRLYAHTYTIRYVDTMYHAGEHIDLNGTEFRIVR